MRHLFLDDAEIERMDGLHRSLNSPSKFERNPVLRCETPWEMLGVQTYGTALCDESDGLFKIWYLTHAGPSSETILINGVERLANMTLLAYAYSEDGIEWCKPKLGQIDFQGSNENNLLAIGRLNVEGASVLLEPDDPDPSRRFKAFYWEHGSGEITETEQGGRLWGKGEGDGMWISFSPDGVNWTNYEGNPIMDYDSDTGQSVVWDPRIRMYVAFGRFGAGGRKVARSESQDFIHWSSPQLVLEPDAEDGPATQLYGISVTIHEGIYVGLLWVFHVEGQVHGRDLGKIDVQLVSSRDGVRWHRLCDREVFIPNGERGSWDSSIIQAACRFITLEDRHLIYYNATSREHGRASGGNSEIGLATLRRDGFVSLVAGEKWGELITRPVLKSGQLHLNVDASRGELMCELLGPDGVPLSGPSLPIGSDSTDEVVRFPDPTEVEDVKVVVRFKARRTELYSYWFE